MLLQKPENTTGSSKMKPVSTNLVATRLAKVAMSAKVPAAIIAAHQEESFMVHLRRQAVSVESEDEKMCWL